MASRDDTNLWLQFFKDAGVPSNVAVKYALTFVENRIKKDMLLDLNKEYLKEMGITLMGDVIAILKHAKEVYEEDARSNVLKNNSPVPISVASSTVNRSAASRILEHCIPKETMPPPAQRAVKKIVRTNAVAKRIISKTVIKTKPQHVEEEVQVIEPPTKKVRRVLPEHEGKYKVIMPAGTTPRTQKILSNIGPSGGGKKTVFERLGDSTVSSTTSVTTVGRTDQPKITITGISSDGSSLVRPTCSTAVSTEKMNSVFSRLGNKPMGVATQSVREDDVKEAARQTAKLQYAGILKKSSPVLMKKKIIKLVKKNKISTLKADMPQTMQLQERLGMSALPTPPTIAKVMPMRKKLVHDTVKPFMQSSYTVTNKPLAERTGVKVRLGSSIVTTTTATKQVVQVNRSIPAPAAANTTQFTRTFNTGNVFARLGR